MLLVGFGFADDVASPLLWSFCVLGAVADVPVCSFVCSLSASDATWALVLLAFLQITMGIGVYVPCLFSLV